MRRKGAEGLLNALFITDIRINFPEETAVILMHKRTTETEGIWIEIKRKEKSGWVQGWVKSESIKFNWKEDSLENLIESK